MSGNYTHRVCICSPVSIKGIANEIGRALDPDTGGNKSFDSVTGSTEENEYVICDVIATTEFAQSAETMLGNPDILFYVVSQDYLARWSDLVPPSLEDCQTFLTSSKIVIEERGKDLQSLLSEIGITLS
jgi:hypothetical protein